jgi:hypothetical protein
MKKLCTTIALLATLATFSYAALTKTDAESAARTWLALVDSGKYSDSWTESSSKFRSAITSEAWTQALKGVREPLGALKSRNLLKATLSKTMAGMPDGDYALLQFDTVFQNKAKAVETVSLMGENGQWKIAGYFIK